MRAINFYDLYIKGFISLTDGYAKVTELILKLYEDLDADCDNVVDLYINFMIELDDHEAVREYYEEQQDLFAQRIAHNFMLANDYAYKNGYYEKSKPNPMV